MQICKDKDVEEAVINRLEEGCREHLKKVAYRYIKTGREEVYASGMMMAAEIGQAKDGLNLSIVVVVGGIFVFDGKQEEILDKIYGIVRTNIDTPVKVLGKMAYIRMKRFEEMLRGRNSTFIQHGQRRAHNFNEHEELPDLSKKELWGPAIAILKQSPWGTTQHVHHEADIKKFLARDEVTDEVLQVGWDMMMTKELITA
jgi:hypothetical protein